MLRYNKFRLRILYSPFNLHKKEIHFLSLAYKQALRNSKQELKLQSFNYTVGKVTNAHNDLVYDFVCTHFYVKLQDGQRPEQSSLLRQ